MKSVALWLTVACCMSGICAAQQRPDPKLTPGAVRTTNARAICAPSFRTKPFRKTTSAMKHHVCALYHVSPCPVQGKMELDHLVPLEIGGADVEANLWPQFAPEFHWKDTLENELRKEVCTLHTLSLTVAQTEIRTDWVAAYKKHVGTLPADNAQGGSLRVAPYFRYHRPSFRVVCRRRSKLARD